MDTEPDLKVLVELAGRLPELARQAVAWYAPIVDSILRSRSRDVRSIETALDGLLGFCFDPEALLLFKKLCRHYYSIDPGAAADYVYAYRDMWDSEDEAASDE
jgi:hypothetical protein